MKNPNHLLKSINNSAHCTLINSGDDGLAFQRMIKGKIGTNDRFSIRVILSWGMSWDHISVSRFDGRMPGWYELEDVKHFVALPHETFVQYHVPRVDHVNNGEVAHLWRPHHEYFPRPPRFMV